MKRRVKVSAFKDVKQGIDLTYKRRPVLMAAGRGVSKVLKQKLRRGKEPDGRALPAPEDGGRPLRRTGSLIKSLGPTVAKRGGNELVSVWAKGTRNDLGENLGGRQAGLLGVLIYGRKSESKRPRMDPMRYVDAMTPEVEARVDKELDKQLRRGAARLRFTRIGAARRGSLARALLARKR